MFCELSYIPKRLHLLEKKSIQYFSIGETLFRRCKKEEKLNHFDNIQIFDISVNRRGLSTENILSEPEDVLLNFSPRNSFEKFDNDILITLEIKELNEDKQFEKIQENCSTKNTVRVFLNHRIEPCNYSHCCFEFYFNGEEVSKENYKKSLRTDTELKDFCKFELTKMLIKEEVRLNWD